MESWLHTGKASRNYQVITIHSDFEKTLCNLYANNVKVPVDSW